MTNFTISKLVSLINEEKEKMKYDFSIELIFDYQTYKYAIKITCNDKTNYLSDNNPSNLWRLYSSFLAGYCAGMNNG